MPDTDCDSAHRHLHLQHQLTAIYGQPTVCTEYMRWFRAQSLVESEHRRLAVVSAIGTQHLSDYQWEDASQDSTTTADSTDTTNDTTNTTAKITREVQRVMDAARTRRIHARFYHVESDYYDWPLQTRAYVLISSSSHLTSSDLTSFSMNGWKPSHACPIR